MSKIKQIFTNYINISVSLSCLLIVNINMFIKKITFKHRKSKVAFKIKYLCL